MRTNIIIDDQLMADALKATGLNTKKEAVELGLKTLVRLKTKSESGNIAEHFPGKEISRR